MCLNERGLGLDQGVLNWTCEFRWEHGSRVHRTGHRLFPGLQHLIHLSPNTGINQSICFHEGRVELPTKEQGIWRADILDDGIEDVESR